MSIKEQVVHDLDRLGRRELRLAASYIAYLRARAAIHKRFTNGAQRLSALYAEFAEEDRALAEEGMSDYASGLRQEDTQ